MPEGVLFKDIAGEAVLLNLNTETYFGLDEVGTRMWQVATTSETLQHAYDTLLEEYDVQSDVLRADLMRLIDELVSDGLLELVLP
ncbi:MAG: PqqD family protein [Chloroflexi bacterium]|nr:PqqD family protein [Chloroflexota bacterium]